MPKKKLSRNIIIEKLLQPLTSTLTLEQKKSAVRNPQSALKVPPRRRQCKIFTSCVNFFIFTHFFVLLSLKLSKLGAIYGVKFLAWKSGDVKFWTNLMSALYPTRPNPKIENEWALGKSNLISKAIKHSLGWEIQLIKWKIQLTLPQEIIFFIIYWGKWTRTGAVISSQYLRPIDLRRLRLHLSKTHSSTFSGLRFTENMSKFELYWNHLIVWSLIILWFHKKSLKVIVMLPMLKMRGPICFCMLFFLVSLTVPTRLGTRT